MIDISLKAALFDLDGVVFDTEPQYTIFWGGVCRHYHPNEPGLEHRIKGQTLTQIFDGHFAGMKEEQKTIVEQLNEFEQHMDFCYVEGFLSFVADLRRHGVKTAVVTSSNVPKMQSVYQSHEEFRSLFDAILTSEDFEHSKPHPDCYLKAAAKFGLQSNECVVFEDSFNGLKAGMAAGMTVVGLATTNPAEAIEPLCHRVIADYREWDFERFTRLNAVEG